MNPVTGETQFKAKNDLGMTYYIDDEHEFCRYVNNGNCPHYAELSDESLDGTPWEELNGD